MDDGDPSDYYELQCFCPRCSFFNKKEVAACVNCGRLLVGAVWKTKDQWAAFVSSQRSKTE